MSKSVILDTNIIILYLKGDKEIISEIQRLSAQGVNFIISAITLAELLGYQNLSKKEENNIYSFTSYTNVAVLDEGIAIEAGKLARKENLRLGDSIIAATALLNDCVLLTRDKKHFQKVKSIDVALL